ncbi:MAG: hypothetical protein AAF927_11295 [Bacteroidota bacterium]
MATLLLPFSVIGLLLCFWVLPRVKEEGLSIWSWLIGMFLIWPLFILLAGWRLEERSFQSIGAIGIIVLVFILLLYSGKSFMVI